MKKNSFIPKSYRPYVPGSKIQELKISKNIFDSKQTRIHIHILLISAKEDIVPHAFLKEIDGKDYIQHLFYDDLGIDWDFAFHADTLKVFTIDGFIIPKSIYHRHPGIPKDHKFYHKHVAFFEVLDLWKGNLIGQKRDHFQNSSKMYQAITSIHKAKTEIGDKKIQYPRSFFLKGDFNLLKNRFNEKLIVKSCSNMRSKVVSEEEFSHWNLEHLYNLPTLFQEKIIGKDIRVHLCENELWTLLVETKDCVDYRYASKGSVIYKKINLSKCLNEFCKLIATLEKNRFIGVDLMESESGYFCLESNPGPGWSTFNHPSKMEFAKKVFKKLLKTHR